MSKLKILPIIKHPNPILRKKSENIDISKINEICSFINNMVETIKKNKRAAGLAAPQVGRNIRLILVNNNDDIMVMINPVITKKSWARIVEKEGCLSVGDDVGDLIYKDVQRHKKINFIYFNEKGKKIKAVAKDFLARVVQHEIDHLDGILFIDKIN